VGKLVGQGSPQARSICETVIDIYYNYVVEGSIWGVSKHYRNIGDDTWSADLRHRLAICLAEVPATGHQFHSAPEEIAQDVEFESLGKFWRTPDWILDAVQESSRERDAVLKRTDGEVPELYEDALEERRRAWRLVAVREFFRHFTVLVGYVVGFVALNWALSWVNAACEAMGLPYLPEWIYSIILLIVFSVVTSLLMKAVHLPDIVESFAAVWRAIWGWWKILTMPKGVAYVRP
jgi:hypothetical protein